MKRKRKLRVNQVQVCFVHPGHRLRPVIGSGWLGLAQPMWVSWAQPKNKEMKKKIESVGIKILHVLGKMYFCQFIH
jgi:hypothetical protein